MVTIKTMDDFKKLKNFTTTPICYVYYKNTLLNTFYVGYTTQNGYKYLRNHHRMKKISDRINEGYSIQIYTKYNESALISLFKPKLNVQSGNGYIGRNIGYTHCNTDLKNVVKSIGEIILPKKIIKYNKKHNILSYSEIKRVIDKTKRESIYNEIWNNIFINIFINKKNNISLHFDIVLYIINIHKLKPENNIYNEIFNSIKSNDIYIKKLCSILKYCKIKYLFQTFILIYEIYINNTKELIRFTSETSKNIQYEIIQKCIEYDYLISSPYIYYSASNYLPYYYQFALKDYYQLIYESIN